MDDLVLNLAEAGPSTRAVSNKKGGRWTERCVYQNIQTLRLFMHTTE
jgi:hypothetical protein